MKLGEAIRQPHFADEHEEAVVNLLFTSQWWQRLLTLHFKPFGLTPEQYNILRILHGNRTGTYCLQEIQARLLNKTSNTTRVVEKLRQKGLLTRRLSRTNRRKVDIKITEDGSELVNQMNVVVNALDDRIRQAISKEEARQFSAIADKMRTNFDFASLPEVEN